MQCPDNTFWLHTALLVSYVNVSSVQSNEWYDSVFMSSNFKLKAMSAALILLLEFDHVLCIMALNVINSPFTRSGATKS